MHIYLFRPGKQRLYPVNLAQVSVTLDRQGLVYQLDHLKNPSNIFFLEVQTLN